MPDLVWWRASVKEVTLDLTHISYEKGCKRHNIHACYVTQLRTSARSLLVKALAHANALQSRVGHDAI